jgi:hypothetical protein
MKLSSFAAIEVSLIVMSSHDAKLSSWAVTEMTTVVVATAAAELTIVVAMVVELSAIVVAAT